MNNWRASRKGTDASNTRFDWDDGVTTWQATAYDAASRVTQIWNRNATITNAYLDDNSLTSQDEVIKNYADLIHRKVTYAYDADGNRANITYPSGKDFSYGYTGRNQLWYVMDDLSGIYQAVFVYDLSGNMTTRYVGNNWIVTDASQRDAVNQITHLEHRFVGTTRSFDYTFNPRGNRLTSRPDGGTTQNYAYDPTQQVTSAPLNGATQTFTYDNNGNRTGTNGGVYAINSLNQYTTFHGLGATYDLNGNLKTYNGWTYTYDAQNRLTTVKQGTTTVAQYWYDGLNRQITRNVKGAITFHVWDGWNLIEERATGNALQNVYLYAGDQIIENVTTKRFYFQDSLGNTTHLSDEAGNLLERYTYSAFGTPFFFGPPSVNNPAGAQLSESTKGTRHLFQGQLWTQETGLNDYRNRVELPSMGVFLQPDPIGLQIEGMEPSGKALAFFPPGQAPKAFTSTELNLYRYCHNDPINKTDPDGLYGRGDGWEGKDKEWEKFDRAQQAAAASLEKASSKMDAKAFEKAFGKGSATAENMAKVQKTMQGMAAALRDDGSKGYVANAFSDKSRVLGRGDVNGKTMSINLGHSNFNNKYQLSWASGHESGHNLGLGHGTVNGVTAYKYGNEAERDAYKNLPAADRLGNPDNYMDFAR